MFFLVLTSILWGLSFVLMKKYLAGVDPYFIFFMRILISALLFVPFIGYHVKGRFKWKMFKLGLLQFGFMFLFYAAGYKLLDISQVLILTAFLPIYVLLINFIFEFKLRPLSSVLVLLNIFVSSWMTYKDGMGSALGILFIQLANICFAFGQVYYREIRDRIEGNDGEIFFWPYLAGTLVCGLSFFLFGDFDKVSLLPSQWGMLAFLGIFATGLGFFLWNRGANSTSIGNVAIANNLKIPFVLIFGFFLLGESVHWIKVLIFLTLFFGSAALLKSDQEKFL